MAKRSSLPECMHQFTNSVTERVRLRGLQSNHLEGLASSTEAIAEEEVYFQITKLNPIQKMKEKRGKNYL